MSVLAQPSIMRFEVSLIIRATRDKVYSAYTDFEAMPRWSGRTKAVAVLGREGNTVHLEITPSGSGRKSIRGMKLFPPEKVESEGETKFTKTLSVVKFEPVPEGTRVTASLDVEFKGRWGWVMKTQGRAEAESLATEELTSFGKYVESLP
jgi:uncharacterized membrane protein